MSHECYRADFGGFGVSWALMTRRKLQNPLKISPDGNCHSSAPKKATEVPKVPFLNILLTAIFSYKMHFLIKCLVEALDEVEVQV